jgi:arylsulfatase A-like enzyme
MIPRILIAVYVIGVAFSSRAAPAPDKAAPPAAPEQRPNIIFILADDLGYGDLSCYGQKNFTTPNIDRLATQGMRFTQCYAGNTVCAPSRCALLTGKDMGHARIRGNAVRTGSDFPLEPDDLTAAELLKRAGYATGVFGKWGLGDATTPGHPNKKGFDEFFGYLGHVHAHNHFPDFLWHNEEKVPLNNVVDPVGEAGGGVARERREYANDIIVREALGFIQRHAEKPFFLYLALTIPHANNEARQKGMEVPELGPFAEKDWPEPEKSFAAMVTRMDGHVGKLMDLLGAHGLDNRTLVFFSSDNGPHKEGGTDPDFHDSNGPLRGIKRDLYEGGIRVPMIARWSGKIAEGVVSKQVWAFWDFLPTVAQLAGMEMPREIDGISVLPTLLGQSQQPSHEYLYWEFYERGFQQAIRAGDWKGVKLDPKKTMELYDLATDLGETRDVAAERPEVVAKLDELLGAARFDSPDWRPKKAPSIAPSRP